MRCNYKARHVELDNTVVEYCKKRFGKVEKLVPKTAFMEMEFIDEFGGRGGMDKRVEVTLDIPGMKIIHMVNSATDWQSSIDFLQDRLVDEIINLKEKDRDNKRLPKKYKEAEIEERRAGEIE